MPMLEYNRFYPAPSGERGEHIKIMCDTVDELDALLAEVDSLFAHRQGSSAPEARRERTDDTPKSDVVVCGICKGPVYDNRAKKASGEYTERRADFSCKKKSCYAAMWLTREGEHGEWKQFSSR